MKLQDYINIAILGFKHNAAYLGGACLIMFILLANPSSFGAMYPIFDVVRLLVVLAIVGLVMLQSVVLKRDATVRTDYIHWVQSFGTEDYFVDESNRMYETHVTMLVYFTALLKLVELVNYALSTFSGDLAQIMVLSVFCSLQMYALFHVVSMQTLMYPIMSVGLICVTASLVCDRLVHFSFKTLKIVPKKLFDTTSELVKRFTGIWYSVHDKGETYYVQIRTDVYVLLFIASILLNFIKDLFFKDIPI